MIEAKLQIGRCLNLGNPQVAPMQYNDGDFLDQPALSLTIQESTGILTKKSNISQGISHKTHRNFTWLAWFPGAISQVPLHGDVLTGPMSGCWLVIYSAGGVTYAGHLGTDVASPIKSTAVKNAWNAFAATNPGQILGGFNPLHCWAPPFPQSKSGDNPLPKIFGLLTTNQQLFSIFTYPQNTIPTMIRIAGIKRVPSVALGTLQNL